MNLVRQSIRTRPPFGELGDPPLPADGTVLFEEEYCRKPIKKKSKKKRSKQDESLKQKDVIPILRTPSKKELAHADHVERLILETSSNKQRKRQSTILNGEHSYHVDKLLQDKDNDWFFEKILEKFENIRSKRAVRHEQSPPKNVDNNVAYGIERIVERRYYVKKNPLVPKRDQLTSTSDLTILGKKNRQISGVSSSITATSSCSQCSPSTPTFVEDLRIQSNSLRYEINELKTEIEHLQTSQKDFFQHIQTQFQPKPGFPTTTAPHHFDPPAISPLRSPAGINETYNNRPVPLTTNQQPHSASTESLTSTSSSASIPKAQSIAKPVARLNVPLERTRPVSEFIATKNPSLAPTPPVNASSGLKLPSISPRQSFNTNIGSIPSPVPRTSPVTEFLPSKRSSIVSTPTKSASSRSSSTAPTPPRVPSPLSLALASVYEKELAHQRVVSPRSQIVASSASMLESSDSSSESTSSVTVKSNPKHTPKAPVTTLRDNDLQDLVQYSSQLELSGFPPSTMPVITNPNASNTFWESVDEYLENSKSTNAITGLSKIPRFHHESKYGLNDPTTKQLEKYDLEIKPQETITTSAPLLMPPLYISSS